ncbi:MAG TPA: dienelactone hydrolase family protein [Pseudonocardiaceae bacterium]|nr:dienelactone hydrolase family protein [Pseudonocardiaceae bacterium]
MASRLAAEGFVALAPDLFGGATTHDADEAAKLMQELPMQRAARDLGGAVDYLLGHDAVTSSTIGAVGFCMGGGFVLVLAAQQGDKIGAAVTFYGVLGGPYPSFVHLCAPLLGRAQARFPLLSGGARVLQRSEPARHQAAKAWDTTVSFLRQQLAAPQHG